MIILLGLDGWANHFQAVFFLEINLFPPNQVNIANFQPNSMKGTSKTQYHDTFKEIKPNIEPIGNLMYSQDWLVLKFLS